MLNQILIEIGMLLQSKLRFIPVLIDDFGLEKRSNVCLASDCIKLLIPETYVYKHWERLVRMMNTRSFELCDSSEHTFCRNGTKFSFASIEEFEKNTGISTKKLPRVNSPFTYFLPSLSQFYVYYNYLYDNSPQNQRQDLDKKIDLLKDLLRQETVSNTREFLRNVCDKEHLSNDYTHYVRVAEMCRTLAAELQADEYVCVMSALLYDIDSVELSENVKNYKLEIILKKEFVSSEELDKIKNTIKELKDGGKCKTREGKCLSDAYNLDYVGAVGIAMGFAEYSRKRLPMYPLDAQRLCSSGDVVLDCRDALEHFSRILNSTKKKFYSDTAKKLAADRAEFMQDFLYRFYDECEGML